MRYRGAIEGHKDPYGNQRYIPLHNARAAQVWLLDEAAAKAFQFTLTYNMTGASYANDEQGTLLATIEALDERRYEELCTTLYEELLTTLSVRQSPCLREA